MRLPLAVLACAALLAQAPEARPSARGLLRYSSGRKQVELQIIEGNHPALIALRPETGEAAAVREFLLTHSGPEKFIAADSIPLKQTAPAAWKVEKHRGAKLIQTDEATYWCYTPGLVLPSAFRLGPTTWTLQSAELPPLLFVELR